MSNPIIEKEKLYLVTDIPGYTPNISRLICMMNYARQVTLHSVNGLTVKELDHIFDDKSNSIGALLLHIASVEYFYQKFTFEERDLTEEETVCTETNAENAIAPVAQLDRASVFGTEGWGFEPLRVRHLFQQLTEIPFSPKVELVTLASQ